MINQSQRFNSSAWRYQITVKKFIDKFEQDFVEEKMTAIVIQASPKDLEFLDEGERAYGTIKVFSPTQLKFGDRVIFKDKEYRVVVTGDWGLYGYYYNLATELASTQKNNSGGFVIT